jgi:hypothetical protein
MNKNSNTAAKADTWSDRACPERRPNRAQDRGTAPRKQSLAPQPGDKAIARVVAGRATLRPIHAMTLAWAVSRSSPMI